MDPVAEGRQCVEGPAPPLPWTWSRTRRQRRLGQSSASLVQSAFSQRAAASALSSGRVLNAIAASGAALAVNFAKLPELLRRKD